VRAVEGAVSDAEADTLFADLAAEPALVLAISGGPDSTALLYLMARWRGSRRQAPRLFAVTVDHGLRPEARHEAAAVGQLCERLGIEHHIMLWSGAKPSTGIQEAARSARYRLLRTAACRAQARCVVAAHTLDDQAETVLFRMARGSGLAGLCGMASRVPIHHLAGGDRQPIDAAGCASDLERFKGPIDVLVIRPLLDIPKARLIVTLKEAGIAYADDPTNADPRFARSRMRKIMQVLAGEGLTSQGLARLARRVRRSEAALEAVVDMAAKRVGLDRDTRKVSFPRADWSAFPDEIALRLLGRSIAVVGTEGPVEFGKLETLNEALGEALAKAARFRRTLAGAMVSLQGDCIIVDQAPARRAKPRHADPQRPRGFCGYEAGT
jgi:tRNA(Ile)-lysidine synthase